MNNKKYELTDETKELRGRVLHRIKALKDFRNVKTGDLGGWIEKEKNLSQEGNCWVYEESVVCDNAKVYDNAKVFEDAEIYDNAKVFGNARVFGDGIVCQCAKVFGNAKVYDNAKVFGNARVFGDARVFGYAEVLVRAEIYENAEVWGDAIVFGDARVFGYAEVWGDARVYDNAKVYDYAKAFGESRLYENAELYGDNKLTGRLISKVDEYIDIQNPKGRLVTCILKNGNILYNVGCQVEITKEDFIDRIYNTNGGIKNNPHREYYLKIIKMAEMYFNK